MEIKEELLRFVEWTKLKIKIHVSERVLYFREGEIFAAVLTQLRLLSSKRLLRKINVFPLEDFEQIREKIRKLI